MSEVLDIPIEPIELEQKDLIKVLTAADVASPETGLSFLLNSPSQLIVTKCGVIVAIATYMETDDGSIYSILTIRHDTGSTIYSIPATEVLDVRAVAAFIELIIKELADYVVPVSHKGN